MALTIPQLETVVTKNERLTEDVIELTFKLQDPTEFTFTAGQFVFLKHETQEGRTISRCYSLASAPTRKNEFDLCVKIVEGGQVSPFLGTLKEGDQLTWYGPMGHFILRRLEETKHFYFIATGTGIAPMNPFIAELLEAGETRDITLFFGLRHVKDIYYKEFYEQLAAKYSNFHLILTLSQPETDWSGNTGRVTDMIKKHIDSAANTESYLCGSGEMIAEVKELLLEKGASKDQIYMEKYY